MPVIRGGELHSGIRTGRVYKGAGAPTTNVTLVGVAEVGDLYSNVTAGTLYICTATNGSTTIVWTVVGTQT